MPVSHRYTLSDQLKLWFFVAVSVLYTCIFMSVYIAERPTFEKIDRGVFANVICLVLIFLYQLMVTVCHSDSIKIILRPGSCIDLWQIKRVKKIYIYIFLVTSKTFT